MSSDYFKSKSWFLPKTKTRPNRAWIHCQPYDYGVYVLWPASGDLLQKEYTHAAKDDGTNWPEGAFDISRGVYLSNGQNDCIAFKDDKPDPGIIAHEAYHYVCNLVRQLDLEGEEAPAYLINYLTDRIYELTRGKPCKV